MKKLFILLQLIFVMPSFALCSIESTESICTLPKFNTNNSSSVFKNTNAEANLNNTNQPMLQPLQRDDLFEKIKTPNNELMKYDSGCQFGSCLQDLNKNIPFVK